MPLFILLAIALLVFAVTVQLLALQYQPAMLIALFSSLPLSQQITWGVIGLVPLLLIAVAVLQHCKLIEKKRTAEALETRLRSIRQNVHGLEQTQQDAEQALQQSAGETTISTEVEA